MSGDQEGNIHWNDAGSFLTQVVTQPTKENGTLDLVLTTDTNLARDCQVAERQAGFDHYSISFSIRIDHQRTDKECKL